MVVAIFFRVCMGCVWSRAVRVVHGLTNAFRNQEAIDNGHLDAVTYEVIMAIFFCLFR